MRYEKTRLLQLAEAAGLKTRIGPTRAVFYRVGSWLGCQIVRRRNSFCRMRVRRYFYTSFVYIVLNGCSYSNTKNDGFVSRILDDSE